MHGLILRAFQSFACATYGAERWERATQTAGCDGPDFESMLIYDQAQSMAVIAALCDELGRPREELLEDLGTYLVSHPETESLRRLLRFGGETYADFLHSLDDLPDRARLAVSDLDLPRLELREHTPGLFTLSIGPGLPGFGWVLMGILRAMADDYGALAMLDHQGVRAGDEVIEITLVESAFAEGRHFDLGARRA